MAELEEMLKGMDSKEVLQNLKDLIDQTYVIEDAYEGLKKDYAYLQSTIEGVIEALPNALWIVDKEENIFLQNSKAKELPELLNSLTTDSHEYERNFSARSYLVKVQALNDKYIISATDITEQKRKESLATMGQMAAHLSHEIRNPIGSIALLTSTLLKRVKTENKPIVFEIQKAIFRIERIIRATLMFSKGVSAQKEPFSLAFIKEELENAVSYYSYSKEIRFEFEFPSCEIVADKELISMVFSNFVFNAIDAIEEDEADEGVVEIAYSQDRRYHIFTITDSGVPIANPEELFEAFKSTKEKGNGLGLVLSQQIVSCHEGDIALLEGSKKGFEIRLLKK